MRFYIVAIVVDDLIFGPVRDTIHYLYLIWEPSLRGHFLVPLSGSQYILVMRGCRCLGANKTTSIIIISNCATFSVTLG